MFSPEADRFFMEPSSVLPTKGEVGILYLLRRDIAACLHSDGGTRWPGAMAVLAGIDLLAKFRYGDTGDIGPRFKRFLGDYFHLGSDERETLYQFRNSLIHSFGLYSEANGRVYRFMLTASVGPLLSSADEEHHVVDLCALDKGFDRAIGEYAAALAGSPDLQVLFSEMYSKYGAVHLYA